MTTYIPQALSKHFTHPLVAANIDEIGITLFDWSDPDRSHSYYDLTRDAEQLIGGNEDLCYRAFSRVRHWPPRAAKGQTETGKPATKSALKKHKEMGHKRNISWSSKVTCKTYSKDDANHWVSKLPCFNCLLTRYWTSKYCFDIYNNRIPLMRMLHQQK